MANLKYFLITGGKKPFHLQFRRGGEKPAFGGIRTNELLRSYGRDTEGSFNFDEALQAKESPNAVSIFQPGIRAYL